MCGCYWVVVGVVVGLVGEFVCVGGGVVFGYYDGWFGVILEWFG